MKLCADHPIEQLSPKALPTETTVAWWCALAILMGLWAAKALAWIPVLGGLLLSAAAFVQLYLPMWRCERYGLPYSAVGLGFSSVKAEVAQAARLGLPCLAVYALVVHLLLTQSQPLLAALGLGRWGAWLPHGLWAPPWARSGTPWGLQGLQGLTFIAAQVLGVALPEETFYRGYLQPQLERLWPPQWRIAGVALGRGAAVSAALFALGHWLGEWNVARLGPFFPGLLFAWLRNRTGTVGAAVLFHAMCNITSELLFSCYR